LLFGQFEREKYHDWRSPHTALRSAIADTSSALTLYHGGPGLYGGNF